MEEILRSNVNRKDGADFIIWKQNKDGWFTTASV